MKNHPMLSPPAGYDAISCVAGYGGYPHDVADVLKRAGHDVAVEWGGPLGAVLVCVYLITGTLVPLWIVINIAVEAVPGEAVAMTTDAADGTWVPCPVPTVFEPLILAAQTYESLPALD